MISSTTHVAVLLTPEAFNAFLPAYMLRALDDLTVRSITLEFTVYSLCPTDSEESLGPKEQADCKLAAEAFLKRASSMTPAQVQASRTFLEFVQENAKEGTWLRRFITPAMETVWA